MIGSEMLTNHHQSLKGDVCGLYKNTSVIRTSLWFAIDITLGHCYRLSISLTKRLTIEITSKANDDWERVCASVGRWRRISSEFATNGCAFDAGDDPSEISPWRVSASPARRTRRLWIVWEQPTFRKTDNRAPPLAPCPPPWSPETGSASSVYAGNQYLIVHRYADRCCIHDFSLRDGLDIRYTFRWCCRSNLFPTSTRGMFSFARTRDISFLYSIVSWKLCLSVTE